MAGGEMQCGECSCPRKAHPANAALPSLNALYSKARFALKVKERVREAYDAECERTGGEPDLQFGRAFVAADKQFTRAVNAADWAAIGAGMQPCGTYCKPKAKICPTPRKEPCTCCEVVEDPEVGMWPGPQS